MTRPLHTVRLFPILALILLFAGSGTAQWRNLAPGLLDPGFGFPQIYPGGAMAFKDGNLWVGIYDLFVSSDLGKTWTKRTPVVPVWGGVGDIDLFSAVDCVIASGQDVYVTHDGGITWIHAPIPKQSADGVYTAFFLGSANEIAAPMGSSGLYISRDGGLTWTNTNVGVNHPIIYGRWAQGSTCYMIMEDPSVLTVPSAASYNQLVVSNDRGATWTAAPTSTYVDCYSFAADSCDPKRICLINESGVWSNFPNGDSACIFTTSDQGVTWQRKFTVQQLMLCGSISASQNALYAQTSLRGVLRSLDHGVTWKSIGGPGSHWDTRYVVAANDNIVFAVDSTDGSVWGTFNSGGDSLPFPQTGRAGGIVLTEDSLFIGDSILQCDQPLQRVLHFRGYGCTQPTISQMTFQDSSAYSAATTSGDSVLVTLNPVAGGSATQMVLHLSDGSFDTVQLLGGVKPSAPFSVSSVDQTNDTIGGTVYVPITLAGITSQREVELVLRYDPVLQYLGSFSVTGSPLDIAGEQWTGRSKLHLSNVTSGVILGYAEFTVMYDPRGSGNVFFDSLQVVQSPLPCEYLYAGPHPYAVNVTLPTQCGAFILSNYLLTGKPPKLSITPNPAATSVMLISDRSIGEVRIELVDQLGKTVLSKETEVTASHPCEIDVNMIAPGAYRLRVVSSVIDASAGITIVR
ncbi:MAG: hypothetical protein JSS75_10100 [Bacteroidetes bacterium]|nr:hypothetical protein [Bacteroidota bacterium]